MNIDKSLKIMNMFKSSAATKLQYSQGDYSIKLEKAGLATANTEVTGNIEKIDRFSGKEPVEGNGKQKQVIIVSPFIGVFNDGSSADKLPLVMSGDKVNEGQTVCLVEGVQGKEEVHAPEDGVITAIHVANGESVEYGRGLFTLSVEGDRNE